MDTVTDIHIAIIPHVSQRYDTAGDYIDFAGNWLVNISATADWRHSFLVMIHELVEMGLTKNDGVDWDEIDLFDISGLGKEYADPGDLESAPYHKQHVAATMIEREVAKLLNVNWDEYNEALDSMEYNK